MKLYLISWSSFRGPSYIEDLANVVESAATFQLLSGTGDKYRALIASVIEKAMAVKAKYIDSRMVVANAIVDQMRFTSRELTQLASRVDNLISTGRFDDALDEAAAIGHTILNLSHYSIDSVQDGLKESLQKIGSELHLLDALDRNMIDGGASRKRASATVKSSADEMVRILTSL